MMFMEYGIEMNTRSIQTEGRGTTRPRADRREARAFWRLVLRDDVHEQRVAAAKVRRLRRPVTRARFCRSSCVTGADRPRAEGRFCRSARSRRHHRVQPQIGAGFFGGEGFILQRISGDGLASSTPRDSARADVSARESLRVDTGCLVAMQENGEYTFRWFRVSRRTFRR